MTTPNFQLKFCRLGVLGFLAVLFALPTVAADYFASNASQVTSALQQAGPGDTVVLTDGVWTDQYIRFNDDGNASNPITLRAQTPGGVILTGSSRLDISGDYLVVDGLRFENGALSGGQHVVRFTGSNGAATHSRLTNSTIINYNPANQDTRYFWVSMYGTDNRVDHNRFSGQNHSGVTVTVWRNGSNEDRHLIDANHFLDRPVGPENGYETIRIGDSSGSLSDSRTVIQNNLFERTNGEIEIISVKSGDNDVRYNTFREASGTVTLRHGNGNRVEGNFFLGENANGTGGVRIIGEDHVIANNYLQDLDGRANGGIVLTAGEVGNPLNGYAPVKNTVIAHNTIVNITDAGIKLNDGQGSDGRNALPDGVTIANNIVRNATLLFDGAEGTNFTWEGNIASGGVLFIPPRPGIMQVDPQLVLGADGLYRPAPGSPAIDAVAANAFVSIDMDGQARTGQFDIGADEFSAAQIVRKPLSSTDVGPIWDVPPTGDEGYLAFQAEDFDALLDPNNDGDTWTIVDAAGAHGGFALQAPGGSLTDPGSEPHDALALYDLSFDEAGSYTAYYRARGFSGSTDSFFAPGAFDEDPDENTTTTDDGQWRWETGEVFVIDQSHVDMPLQLRLGRREATTQLDAIILHTIGNLTDHQLDALIMGIVRPGDYNGNGTVEQGDLDLVLANWGVDTATAGLPNGWNHDNEDIGQIAQEELDRVLANWGAVGAPALGGLSVPEPGVLAMVLVLSSCAACRRRS